MIKQQILIVSDDPELYTPIQYKLGGDTTETHCVSSISAAVSHIMKNGYCLIMLDLQLSGMDKAEMIRIIRIMQHIPVVAISEHLESAEIVTLYHAGIDAYIEKPVDTDVCAAQIEALIAFYLRAGEKTWKRATLAFGSSLVISPYHRQVLVDGTPIELTRKEFDLLHHFAQHPHQVFIATIKIINNIPSEQTSDAHRPEQPRREPVELRREDLQVCGFSIFAEGLSS